MGSGPKKSTATSIHGSAGSCLRFIGTGADGFETRVHPLQDLIIFLHVRKSLTTIPLLSALIS